MTVTSLSSLGEEVAVRRGGGHLHQAVGGAGDGLGAGGAEHAHEDDGHERRDADDGGGGERPTPADGTRGMPYPAQDTPARRVAAYHVAQIGNVWHRLATKRGQQLIWPAQGARAGATDGAVGEVFAHGLGDVRWQLAGQLGHE